MKIDDLIFKLQMIREEVGNANIYQWNDSLMKHIDVNDIKLISNKDFKEDIEDDEYIKDFKMINNNVIIL